MEKIVHIFWNSVIKIYFINLPYNSLLIDIFSYKRVQINTLINICGSLQNLHNIQAKSNNNKNRMPFSENCDLFDIILAHVEAFVLLI